MTNILLALRRRGIVDASVLRAMDETPREHFVPAEQADTAYEDHALPIACGQTISQPYVVAYMTEQLAVKPGNRALEIGTGSGYQAAVLSRLAREVWTVERYRTLAETARVRIETLGLANVHVVTGDGMLGLPEQAPFDRIIVTAAADGVPQALVDQLADGGTMLLPLGAHDGVQTIVRLRRKGAAIAREDLIAVRFVPLLPGRAREL
ncbi:MAG: protein-L-isoaspartate(D-aspartate) O-methyltransferase [Rhizobiales bacterium]|nr:protein-L-isoaspartate(D-aspartate) O-methyltransferase [Hyphomicrobiales bacterium]